MPFRFCVDHPAIAQIRVGNHHFTLRVVHGRLYFAGDRVPWLLIGEDCLVSNLVSDDELPRVIGLAVLSALCRASGTSLPPGASAVSP
jgi:hypothetical protein